MTEGDDTMAAGNGTTATVLVVEDEAHLAAGLKLNLELEGYRVVNARSIREATAELISAAPIDLIRCSELIVRYPFYDRFYVSNEAPIQAEALLGNFSVGTGIVFP